MARNLEQKTVRRPRLGDVINGKELVVRLDYRGLIIAVKRDDDSDHLNVREYGWDNKKGIYLGGRDHMAPEDRDYAKYRRKLEGAKLWD